jgi:type I restriction enzyme S subunit
MKVEEKLAGYKVITNLENNKQNVGWVNPQDVTHQTETVGDAALTHPTGWSVVTIDEIADVNPRVDKAAIPDDLPVSFVPMPAVGAGNGSIHVEETRLAGEVKKGFTAFLEGDVLFAKITPCMENGKMAIAPKLVNGYGFGSTEFHVLRPKPGMDAKYIYYYVSSQAFRDEAERYMTGAVGQKRVSTTYLKQSTIPVAPLDQQKRIVEEIEKQFSRLDEAVANLKRVKANLKRYKAAVLKAAVEGRLVETEAEIARREGRSFETGEQLLQRILETRRSQWNGKGKYKEPAAPNTTDLPELPEGWVWATVEQLVTELMNGYGKRSQAGGTPHIVLRLADIVDGEISFSDVREINCTDNEVLKYALQVNDLLVLRVNGSNDLVGRFALVRNTPADVLYCDHFIRARCVMEYLAIWLGIYGDVERFRRYIDLNKVSSAGQNTVNQSVLSQFSIPVPPVDEQKRIVAEIERHRSLANKVEAQVNADLRRSENLRHSILSRAFSKN